MENNKLETISNLFEDKEIRSIWDKDKEEYYFSIVDVINALAEPKDASDYWTTLKRRLMKVEGSKLPTICRKLKMRAQDGKMRETDTLDTEGIFRLIESIPSSKAEPFKIWLARLGKERIDEVFDPEVAANRVVNYYRAKGYTDEWIKQRLIGIVDRFQLTDIWKDSGIEHPIEFALLTNEIYKTWSGMKANEYKEFKGIRKESLRDNMTNIEVLLTDLGEVATRDISREEHPKGFKENMSVAKRGGQVAKDARNSYEKATSKSAISKNNSLNYKYIDDNKRIENK